MNKFQIKLIQVFVFFIITQSQLHITIILNKKKLIVLSFTKLLEKGAAPFINRASKYA